MDPLSITASVGGVVALGYQISTGLFTLVTTLRDAPKDLEVIRDDTYILCSMLDQIKLFLEPQAASSAGDQKFHLKPSQIGMAVQSCENIFKRIENALQETSKIINGKDVLKGKVKLSLIERSKWPFKKEQLQDLRQEIMHAKLTLNLGLSIAQVVKTNPHAAPNTGAPEETTVAALKTTIASLHKSLSQQDPKTESAKSPAAAKQATVSSESEVETREKKPWHPVPVGSKSSESYWSESSELPRDRDREPTGARRFTVKVAPEPRNFMTPSAYLRDSGVGTNQVNATSGETPAQNRDDPEDDQPLEAWTTSPQAQRSWNHPNHEGTSSGIDCRIAPLAIPQSEIRRILQESSPTGTSAFEALRKCNMEQRGWISDHVYAIGAELLHVEPNWEARLTPSVFGDLSLASMFWITRSVAIKAGDARKWVVPVRGRTDGWAKSYQLHSTDPLAYPHPTPNSYKDDDSRGRLVGAVFRDSELLPSYRAAPPMPGGARRSLAQGSLPGAGPSSLVGHRLRRDDGEYRVHHHLRHDDMDREEQSESEEEEETAPEVVGGDVDDLVAKLIAEWVDFDETTRNQAEDAAGQQQDMSTDEEA